MRDFMSVEYVIRLEDPRQDEVIRMLSALDRHLQSLYPPESNHLLDVESLCAPNIRFFVARRGVDPVGCGALRVEVGYGEVKRMFVVPEARGQNVGRAILRCIEDQAARALYRSGGYAECAPFGEYRPDRLSVFMEKRLVTR